MQGRPHDSEIQGWFCPIPSLRLRERRFKAGTFVFTEAGLEKYCSRCREFWPYDTEFFFANSGTPDGLMNWCRACYREWRNQEQCDLERQGIAGKLPPPRMKAPTRTLEQQAQMWRTMNLSAGQH